MPVYDYVCRDCGHIVEVIHGVHAPGPTKCTVCGGNLRKAVSAPAIVFKGSGWAKKDARMTARPSASSKDGGESTTADGRESTKADAGESTKADGGPSTKPAGDSGAGGTTESSKSSKSTSSTSSSSSSEAS